MRERLRANAEAVQRRASHPTALLQRRCACGHCAGCHDEEAVLQRKGDGQSTLRQAPSLVKEVLQSSGQTLDGAIRRELEPRFGHDLSRVRIHTDGHAAESARQVNALAYTVGRDIVFATGRYSPGTSDGMELLAHELTHVVQQGFGIGTQRSGTAPLLASGHSNQRAESEANLAVEQISSGRQFSPTMKTGSAVHCADEDWDKIYGKHKSFLQKPFDEYKKGLGEIKSTTAGGLTKNEGRPIKSKPGAGTPAAPEITFDVLKEIYTGLAADVASDPAKEKKAKAYLVSLNQAFKIMKIDTVEAQSVYLAHAFIESDQFRQFTETQGSSAVLKGTQKWMDDPTQVQLDTNDLRKRYAKGGDVNPGGGYEFIGRGPVQVTHRPEYVEVIAMLEKTAEQYEVAAKAGDATASANAKLAREAATAIKADPRQAANPKYTFLVSAAFMKKFGADVSAAQVHPGDKWTGVDAASGWVAGGKQKAGSPQAKALEEKSKAYERIYKVLMREAKAKNAAKAQTAP